MLCTSRRPTRSRATPADLEDERGERVSRLRHARAHIDAEVFAAVGRATEGRRVRVSCRRRRLKQQQQNKKQEG